VPQQLQELVGFPDLILGAELLEHYFLLQQLSPNTFLVCRKTTIQISFLKVLQTSMKVKLQQTIQQIRCMLTIMTKEPKLIARVEAVFIDESKRVYLVTEYLKPVRF
jgi:hypothetical protein